MFFRKVKFWDTSKDGGWDGPDEAKPDQEEANDSHDAPKVDAPPVFLLDGESFLHIKRSGLIFGCSTRYNVSPSQTLELLAKIAKIFKDYCGTLSEEVRSKHIKIETKNAQKRTKTLTHSTQQQNNVFTPPPPSPPPSRQSARTSSSSTSSSTKCSTTVTPK